MKNYIQIMRPAHWTKNIFVFVALVFGGKLSGEPEGIFLAIVSAVGGFVCFCLAASAVYVFNDIIDRKTDLGHPIKCERPIASGKLSVGHAAVFSVFCGVVSLISSYMLVSQLTVVIAVYMVLMVLYSVLFKKMMILDVIIISVGFCLRAVAGAVIVGVFISPWLIICTFALCLFLGFGKRWSESELLGQESESFRKTLAGYTPELLAHMLNVSSGLAVVCFLLYATDERTLRVFGTRNLVYTTPFVLYCVFRFSALIQQGRYMGPVSVICKDLPFQIGFCLWVLTCAAIIYAPDNFGNFWAY